MVYPSYIRNFKSDRIAASRALSTSDVRKKLIHLYPTITRIEKSKREDDMRGVDFWVNHQSGRFGVDVKIMSTDPIQNYGRETLVLEQFSDVNKNSPGWTLDREHITDLVVWYFVPTARIFVLDYRVLREAFITNVTEWSHTHQVLKDQLTDMGTHIRVSRAIRIPVPVILHAMQRFGNYRNGVKVEVGHRFCQMPDCTSSARHPDDFVDPMWCRSHYDEVMPRQRELEAAKVLRIVKEEAAMKAKMQALAESRARSIVRAEKKQMDAMMTLDFGAV